MLKPVGGVPAVFGSIGVKVVLPGCVTVENVTVASPELDETDTFVPAGVLVFIAIGCEAT
jgi:hypothetical protein